MNTLEIHTALQRIHQILLNHKSTEADWIASVIKLCASNEVELYRKLNSKHMWGGAGSIANEALADNSGIEEWIWKVEIQEYREIMIQLGEHLMAQENFYPDISSWLLAFNNWNQSGVCYYLG